MPAHGGGGRWCLHRRIAGEQRVAQRALGRLGQLCLHAGAQQAREDLAEIGGGRAGGGVLEIEQRDAVAVEQRVAQVRVPVQVDVGARRVVGAGQQPRQQLRGGERGVGPRAGQHADGAREPLRVQAGEAPRRQRAEAVKGGEPGTQTPERGTELARGEGVEARAPQRLEHQRPVARRSGQDARHAKMGIVGAELRGDGLRALALALGAAVGVHLGVGEHTAGGVPALGARRALGRVGDEPRAHAGVADEPVQRRRAAGQQREAAQPAVVGERPEHRAQIARVQDRRQRACGHRGGDRAPVGGPHSPRAGNVRAAT